jgi:retron-type reverse transcriptase
MNNGNVNNNNKTNTNYVWPVRGDNDSLLLFSFQNIYKNYLKCRKNKRNTINALKFEINCEEYLLDLKQELDTGTYYPSRSVCFMVTKPKLREIFAADFKDRIVHHLLVDFLEKIWEPKFIWDSYACRKNKGTHAGVRRTRNFVRQATQNGSCPAYYLQLDIKNFFMTIDKDILFALLCKHVRNEKILNLAKTLIFHDPTTDYLLKGDRDYLEKIVPGKSLFFSGEKKGLPIGNLTSQFFANVYLNELDQFVKHTLKCRYYLRYCDDFILISKNYEELLQWKAEISRFINTRLRLQLNLSKQFLQPISNGINFLGYIVRRNYVLVRRRVVNNLRTRLDYYEKKLTRVEFPYVRVMYNVGDLEKLNAVLASYFSHFKWANAYRLRARIIEKYRFLKWFFTFENSRIIALYKNPKKIPALILQYRYFKTKFPADVIFFQVGRYFEFYGDEQQTASLLGLKAVPKSRGRKNTYGFPGKLLNRYIKKIKLTGKNMAIIREGERYVTGVKERRPDYRLVFQP